jgi:diaminopimelate decarboxylase
MRTDRAARLLKEALAAGHLGEEAPLAMLTDLDELDANLRSLRAAFPSDTLHAVAIKANPVTAILRRVVATGAGLEAASAGELAQALRLVAAERVVFDSPAKTPSELRFSTAAGVRVNVDSLQELARLEKLALSGGVGLRVNPGIGAGAIAATSTAVRGSKFGIDLAADRDAVVAACARHRWIDGLHVHVGSQGCGLEMLVAGVRELVNLAEEALAAGARIRWLDIGGGLPADYVSEVAGPGYAEYAAALRAEVPGLSDGRFRLVTEFGRHVHARHTVVASRVEYTKRSGGKRIAVIHAGADLFVRTAYMPDVWQHRITVHAPDGTPKTGDESAWDIAGPLCFSGDLVARGRILPEEIEPGDLVVIHDAGAYTLGMWSRYNSRLSPGVFGWLDATGFEVLRRPETVEDVFRFWD